MFGLSPTPDALLRGLVLAMIGLAWVILVVRFIGLRAFSKMTAFDFVVTLAVGSLLATAASSSAWPAFLQAGIAIFALLAMQFVLAKMRRKSTYAQRTVENEPVLLMRDGRFIESALTESRVAKSDVIAKLRAANALQLSKVRAVVLETTGDISVLHGDDFDPELLSGVRNA
ncbi:DUF421 domain-containing protein [Stakelama pacifica]|uniref:Uncharacterized protein DUF421 n=1 Tax=Stakelama pacifica TaxID=517720 RepID=A0A4R6FII0_9SPHN|nr:YetF domain-containing protein [Stakelama pacifica]TDN80305.1 uncharacterized protein DUF421 [Stakelama pacifica]GGO97930.1 DUF421 domain-containing protein [Stakelama pacifica]